MTEKQDNLESFARRIETRIKAGLQGTDSMERLICRLLTNKKSAMVSAVMAQKWTEWRYGKAKETIKHEGTITHEHIDLTRLSDEQFEPIRQLVESAHDGTSDG